MRRALLLFALTLACGREAPPPLGEVRLVVDTDLPVSLTLHLRADVYADDGRWLDARDVARPATTDWPASFSVFLPDGAAIAREVRVRLRVYPEGEVLDYQAPDRLVVNGKDVTPATEPSPTIAVDQLVRVMVQPGVRARAAVVLGGECAGVVSDLDALTTCLTDGTSEDAPLTAADTTDIDALGATVVGTYGQSDAPVPQRPASAAIGDGGPRFDGQVAIPGSAFVLGGVQLSNTGTSSTGIPLGSTPTRLFAISPMLFDQYEYTVARFRALLARGFKAPTLPLSNLDDSDYTDCSWTSTPGDREAYPLTCIDVNTARAACQFDGGDLPTEAEWELVASAWGRDRKTTFPWGAAEPTCDGVTFARLPSTSGQAGIECVEVGARPGARAVTEGAGDTTANAEGPPVFGLGASVSEWTRDSYALYTDPCWATAGRHDPSCSKPAPARYTLRGGSYVTDVSEMLVVFRQGQIGTMGFRDIGFRCVTRP